MDRLPPDGLPPLGNQRVRRILEEESREVRRLECDMVLALGRHRIRQDILDRFPQADATRGFGTIIAGLLGVTSLRIYPASFPTVRDWLAGSSGSAALSGRAGRFAASLAATKAAVKMIDLDAAAPDLAGRVTAVKVAAGLAGRLDAGSSEAASLNALLPKLDATLTPFPA